MRWLRKFLPKIHLFDTLVCWEGGEQGKCYAIAISWLGLIVEVSVGRTPR